MPFYGVGIKGTIVERQTKGEFGFDAAAQEVYKEFFVIIVLVDVGDDTRP